MAEVLDTRLPLAIKPATLDLPGAMSKAAAYRGQMLANEGTGLLNQSRAQQVELGGMAVDEARGKQAAMADFRTRAAAGDENALDAFKAYPDVHAKVAQELDTLSDLEQKEAVRDMLEIGGAAKKVLTMPPDDPRRRDVLQAEMDRLLDEGAIDEDFYDMVTSAEDDELDDTLEMMVVTAQSTESWMTERKAKAATRAAEYPRKESELTFSQKIEIEQQIEAQVKATLGDFGAEDAKEARKAYNQARKQVLTSLGIEPDLTFGGKKGKSPPAPEEPKAPAEEGAAPGSLGATPDSPATPIDVTTFDALPVGAWYIDPGDGKTYQKLR